MSQQTEKIPMGGDDRNKFRSGAEMYIYRKRTCERIKHIAGFPPSTCLVSRGAGSRILPLQPHTHTKEPQFFTARNCSAQPTDTQRTGLVCYRGILLIFSVEITITSWSQLAGLHRSIFRIETGVRFGIVCPI
jgi:hypothetical protein